MKFYRVFCDVEPKRKALEAANAELAAAQSKLSKIKAKIKVYTLVTGSIIYVVSDAMH